MPNDCWLADSKTAHLGLSQSEDDTARWDRSNSVSATRGKNGGTASYIESYIKCIIWWHFATMHLSNQKEPHCQKQPPSMEMITAKVNNWWLKAPARDWAKWMSQWVKRHTMTKVVLTWTHEKHWHWLFGFKHCAAILGQDTKQDILQNKTSSSPSVQGYLALGENPCRESDGTLGFIATWPQTIPGRKGNGCESQQSPRNISWFIDAAWKRLVIPSKTECSNRWIQTRTLVHF